MEDQAAYSAPHVLPAMVNVDAPRGFTRHLCPTCRGTGALGRHETLLPIGDSMVVLTQTRWCPTCKGAGQIWQEDTESELQRICLAADNDFTAADVVAKAS